MTRTLILDALTFVKASVINLTAYFTDKSLTLTGSFRHISALRIIKMLPAKFSYSYIHVE